MYKVLSENCMVCNRKIDSLLFFPRLPLTGIYSDKYIPNYQTFDQNLMVCSACGHAQLKYAIDPEFLYGNTYGFRTSESSTAKTGAEYFARYLQKLFPGRYFSRVVEFGCNDGFLLGLLQEKADKLLGIDPVINDRVVSNKIRLAHGSVEEFNFIDFLEGKPDLVISQHTLEHLENPRNVLENIFDKIDEKTTVVLEFPCFDSIFEKFRYDQIFHQHLQYFSLSSFMKLLEEIDADLIDYTVNYNYWGALLIAFKKGNKSSKRWSSAYVKRKPEEVANGYHVFKRQMETTMECINSVRGNTPIYGYGAALMLPVLSYHLGTDFSFLERIFDDDPQKNGKGYINLPVKIAAPTGFNFANIGVLLTAIDNRRPILKKLLATDTKIVIDPFHIM